ncbi:hypothetical protein AAK967_02345 [Atopobiaceae bacterium 24-176]
MSRLGDELAAFAAVPAWYTCAPQGRRVLRDVLGECPTLRALVVAAGVDPDNYDGMGRRYARWTEGEERTVSEMYWAGADIADMAVAVSRGEGAVHNRLNHMGLYLMDRKKKKEES